MPLNCPQRDENLRLPQGGGRKPRRGHARWLAAIALLVVAAGLFAAYFFLAPATSSAASTAAPQPEQTSSQAPAPQVVESKPAPVEPLPFCRRDFGAVAKREKDIAALQAAGGLVHLLQRRQAATPYDCAAFYLDRGLDVNAVSPEGLTALHYAIKANQPKILRFVIAHGANLEQKAGDKQLEPMGYAYYLALNNPQVNRNPIIAILNDALIKQEQQQKAQ